MINEIYLSALDRNDFHNFFYRTIVNPLKTTVSRVNLFHLSENNIFQNILHLTCLLKLNFIFLSKKPPTEFISGKR